MKIIIEPEVYKKVMHWVNKSTDEVSGLGIVDVEKDGTLKVTEAWLLPQKNTGSETELSGEGIAKLMYKVKKDGHTQPLKWWFHSHPTFNVFWSATDHLAMRDFGLEDWIICTVFNQKEERRSAYFHPLGHHGPWGKSEVFLDELPTTIGSVEKAVNPAWDEEYTKNVKAKHPPLNMISGNTSYSGPVRIWNREKMDWEDIVQDSSTATRADFNGSYAKASALYSAKRIRAKYSNPEIVSGIEAFSAKDRPDGMSKSDWKTVNRLYGQGEYDTLMVRDTELETVDTHGFTTSEWQLLTDEHYDRGTVLALLNDYQFSSDDIVRMAENNHNPTYIGQLLAAGSTVDDIIDMLEEDERTYPQEKDFENDQHIPTEIN